MKAREERSLLARTRRKAMVLASFGPMGLVTLLQMRRVSGSGRSEFGLIVGLGRRLWIRPGTKDKAVFKQHFMDRELYALPRHPDAQVVIDLGAHIGLATESLRRQYPGARIISVEMDRENYELCVRNHASTPNQETVHAAIWSTSGVAEVTDVGNGNWGYRARPVGGGVADPIGDRQTTQALTFSELLRDRGIDRVSILKVDIEGSEAELFEASWREIFASVDLVAVEIHGVDDAKARVHKVLSQAQEDFELEIDRAGEFMVIRPRSRSVDGQLPGLGAVNA